MKKVALVVALILLGSSSALNAQNHVGVILSGHEKACEVTSKGKLYDCEDRRELFMGDVVTKKPSVKDLRIKWAPYAGPREKDPATIEVVSTAPAHLKGNQYVGAAKQYVKDFVKPSGYTVVAAVTRDPVQTQGLPWRRATLMSAIPLKMDWGDEEVASLAIVDPANAVVYRMAVKGLKGIEMVPEKAGIRPGMAYTMLLDAPAYVRKLKVSLIDPTLQDEIVKGLAEIDGAPAGSPAEKAIGKAAYLQLISDAYPAELDLYWLSFQVLPSGVTGLSPDQAETVRALKARCFSRLSR